MKNSSTGIYLHTSKENIFYHNNFINNTNQADIIGSFNNTGDNGMEGNYWSDYAGLDLDRDGIGDDPYVVDQNNNDTYPLMGVFSDFDATAEYNVQTVCNSTISDFQYDGTIISFNVTGEDGTDGFCRMCIPTALMSDYQVFVNGTEVLYDLLPPPISNSTHNYIYFIYHHFTQEVIIVPEFPSFLILPLFMIATLLAVIVYKRKHCGSEAWN